MASDQTRWKSHRYILSGHPSTPSEVSIHTLSCPPPDGMTSKGTILLIHGFPETSYQFRSVIGPLADRGYHVVAPDYRGAGHSSRPRDGHDKFTMATDLHSLLTKHMDIKDKVHVVGHDIGGMIAAAYAMQFPQSVRSVAWGECPLPGTKVYDKAIVEEAHGGLWHFVFHWQTDLPELLLDTPDKVRIYIKSFYDRLCRVSTAIGPEDLDYYTNVFSQPGGMRSGFDVYRAFHQDAEDNKKWLKENGKSKVPCMMLSGDGSFLASVAEDEGKEYFENVEISTVKGSGHWIAEEQPEGFVTAVSDWVSKH